MRVTGGMARGVPLQSPRSPGVRPTTDRVRTALFNVLAGYGLEGALVADLYAGTGSIGVEALSRGAAHADFVEADRKQVDVVRANLTATKLASRGSVLHASVERAIEGMTGPYDFVLMDPPYTKPFPHEIVERIGTLHLLAEGGMAVVGHASRVPAPERCGGLSRWADRRYGDSSLAFYWVAEPDAPTEDAP